MTLLFFSSFKTERGGTSSRLPPVWLLREVERGREGGNSDRLGPHGRYTREQSLGSNSAQRLWKSKPQPRERERDRETDNFKMDNRLNKQTDKRERQPCVKVRLLCVFRI